MQRFIRRSCFRVQGLSNPAHIHHGALLVGAALLVACGTVDPPDFDGVSVYCYDEANDNAIVVHHNGVYEAKPPQWNPGYPQGLQICIRPPSHPAPFDYVNDWAGGGGPGTGGTGGPGVGMSYPVIETELRDLCSTACKKRHGNNPSTLPDGSGPYPVCEDANWTHIVTHPGWTPNDGLNCIYQQSGWLVADGSDVDWTLAPGTGPSTLPVSCDLNGDCVDLFWANIEPFIMPLGGVGPIAAESRGADFLASDAGSMDLAIIIDPMQSPTSGPNDMQPIFGIGEYSAVDCGEDACPFYLGNVFGYGPNTWEIDLEVDDGNGGSVVLPKQIRDAQIDLVQSVMGVRRMSDGIVAFGEGTIHMQLQFTIDSCGACDSTGDGTYTIALENEDVLFGEFDPIPTFTGWSPAFHLNLNFPFQGGFIEVGILVEPDEHPPEAAHSLSSFARCNDAGGYLLAPGDLASTDPDADLAYQHWIVDGELHDPAEPLPVGQHSVAVEAWDTRGAVHRSEPTTFTVLAHAETCP